MTAIVLYLGPSPGFSVIVFSNEFSLFTPTADFLNHGLEESCFFTVIHCQIKWRVVVVHFQRLFLRVEFVHSGRISFTSVNRKHFRFYLPDVSGIFFGSSLSLSLSIL